MPSRGGANAQWCVGLADDRADEFRWIRSDLFPLIEAKGGGKPPLWRGIALDPSGIDTFIRRFSERFAV